MDLRGMAELLGNFGEFFGAIAVVATLVYFGRQISQTNRATTASGARELQQQYAHFYTLIATDPGIRGLVTRLRDPNYVVQSDEEQEQIESFGLLLTGIWLTTAVAYEHGQIDNNQYQIYCADVDVKLSQWPGLRPHVVATAKKYPESPTYEILRPLYN